MLRPDNALSIVTLKPPQQASLRFWWKDGSLVIALFVVMIHLTYEFCDLRFRYGIEDPAI